MPALLRRLLCLCTAVALLAPAPALADGSAVIRDCTDDGSLSKRYSQEEYRDALADLPTDVDEYTDCRDVIRNGQLGGFGTGGAGGAGGSGGGTAFGGVGADGSAGGGAPGPYNAEEALAAANATPQERARVAKQIAAGAEPVRIGERVVEPGALGFGSGGAVNGIPASLVVVLVLLGLALGAAGGQLVRQRVHLRRPAA